MYARFKKVREKKERMGSSPTASTPYIPNKKGAPHKHVEMETSRGELVQIDEGLSEVISLMWEKGFETQYCCEGYDWDHPEYGDEHSWSADQYRAYILMPWTPRTFDLVLNLQQNFFRFHGDVPVRWTIEFEQSQHFGRMHRICLRFPKSDIPHIAELLKEQY